MVVASEAGLAFFFFFRPALVRLVLFLCSSEEDRKTNRPLLGSN